MQKWDLNVRLPLMHLKIHFSFTSQKQYAGDHLKMYGTTVKHIYTFQYISRNG